MEEFTEEHAKLLLNKEWMVKVDAGKATPYLMKYHLSFADLSCCILLTDTKSVWTEVVNSKLLARRWRACNPTSPEPFAKTGDEDAWRERTLELLSKAHTIGGIAELSFEIVDSKYSDLAFELECEAFKWKWETCFLGHQRSSEIISKHLIFPLISLNHLTFASAEAVSELSDGDLEKTVDKLGRTARRTVDNHIKNALSKPRVATSIRRMTAMFNFVPELPPIASISEKPLLEVEETRRAEMSLLKPNLVASEQRRNPSTNAAAERLAPKRERSAEVKPVQPLQVDSATESEADEPMEAPNIPDRSNSAGRSEVAPKVTLDNISSSAQAASSTTKPVIPMQSSDPESPPARPVKKSKPAAPPTSDDDSELDNKKSRSGSAAATGGVKRGTRQPVKRGGKRF
ncbi:hypothetical protein GALMADRAFT_247681 [Galerina marginata CBS 339.88]|uniref:XLF-like N-terminal domain-containing protein n=1 Tax=Galerina marginata (strain CBS 339.88) TaxID=685588 RepID=A0A067T1V7_GALM3|nr:hypothetical protein GALMADRAFT_247681 [Galerina marginata CBS 339.88]